MATTKDEQPIERTWLSIREAAAYVHCGRRVIDAAVQRGELRAAPLTARGDLRIKREWVDAWMTALAERRQP